MSYRIWIRTQLYRGREEAPFDDEIYDYTRQRKQADLLELNCAILEKKLMLCTAKTLQAKGEGEGSTYLSVVISGAKDIFTLASSTPLLYVRVKCGEAVFHTHPFEKDSTDWASAPMEIKYSEVPQEKVLVLSVMDQTGEELAKKEVEVDLPVGNGFDRWVTFEGSACLRLQVEHKGIPSQATSIDLEAELAELIFKRRHLKAAVAGGLPPMSYATYTSVVAEVEARLCAEIERLQNAVLPAQISHASAGSGGSIRVYEEYPGGPVHVVDDFGPVVGGPAPANPCQPTPAPAPTRAVDPCESTPLVQSLMATLTGRNKVIRQLQDALAGVESGEVRNVGETVLLLASQLEERDTTLAQLKADLPPMSLSALVIDQSNVINTLLAQLHKALGSLNAANLNVERLIGQAVLFGGDVIMQDWAAPPDPILTAPQVAALLARFDETVARVKELEQLTEDCRDDAGIRERQINHLRGQLGDMSNATDDIGLVTAKLCTTFNESLAKMSDMCFYLSGEPEEARTFQAQLPTPVVVPDPQAPVPHLANVLDALQAKLADATLLLYDEAKNTLPRMERLRYMRGGEIHGQEHQKLLLQLKARDMDFDDLNADYQALLCTLANCRQQLEAPIVVPTDGSLDALLADACNVLMGLVPQADRQYLLSLPLRQRLLELLRLLRPAGAGDGAQAIRVTPLEIRGLAAQSPYVRARIGNAVQQTQSAGPNCRWNTPLTFSLEPGQRNLELGVHDRNHEQPLGRANINVDQFPHGTDAWLPLDQGGDLRVRVDRVQPLAGSIGSRSVGDAAGQQSLDGIAQKMENTIDVLSQGGSRPMRPSGRATPSYLHKLADVLWELAHNGGAGGPRGAGGRFGYGDPMGSGRGGSYVSGMGGHGGAGGDGAPGSPGGFSGAPGRGGLSGSIEIGGAGAGAVGGAGGSVAGGHDSHMDHSGQTLEHLSNTNLQFLMRSRAGLIRRIWACLQIAKLSNNLLGKHHSQFSSNRGHRMDIGEFKRALEDVTKTLGEVGSLEDGLAWIVANYFTDTEKRDLGTSPHLYPARQGVMALPGLIESTDMIEARRLSPTKKRSGSPGSRRPPSPTVATYDRRDFLRRLEDAHITVLDSKDGALDGKYFGYDLRQAQQIDGELQGITRRAVY